MISGRWFVRDRPGRRARHVRERGLMCPSPGARRREPAAGSFRSAAAKKKKTIRKSCKRFVELCGGDQGRHRGAADGESSLADTGARYEKHLQRPRCRARGPRSISTRAAIATTRHCQQRIAQATGIFMTGGNQLRLSTIIGGTPVAKAHSPAQCRGCAGRRHQRRREFHQRTHDCVRRGRFDADRRQRASGAGPGPDQSFHHRPAFPRARPHRTPVHGAGVQSVRGRHRPGRGHGGLHWSGQHSWKSRAAAALPWSMPSGIEFSSMDLVEEGRAGVYARTDPAPACRRCHLQSEYPPGFGRSNWHATQRIETCASSIAPFSSGPRCTPTSR